MPLFENRRHRELRTIQFTATAASVDSNVYIADKPTVVKQVQFALAAQGAASSTLDIKKCTGTTAPASGTTVLSSAFALDSTVNTVTTRTLSSTASVLYLQTGDRLAVDLTGTLTGLSCLVQIVVETI